MKGNFGFCILFVVVLFMWDFFFCFLSPSSAEMVSREIVHCSGTFNWMA